jgi:hypothetical protein
MAVTAKCGEYSKVRRHTDHWTHINVYEKSIGSIFRIIEQAEQSNKKEEKSMKGIFLQNFINFYHITRMTNFYRFTVQWPFGSLHIQDKNYVIKATDKKQAESSKFDNPGYDNSKVFPK